MALAVLLQALALAQGFAPVPVLPMHRLVASRPAAAAMVLDLAAEEDTPLPSAAADVQPTIEDETVGDRNVRDVSYAEQFNQIFSGDTPFEGIRTSKPVPKPSNAAQRREPGSKRIPFSGVWGTLMRPTFKRKWETTDYGRAMFFGFNHALGIFAPLCFFSWRLLGIHFLLYCASAMGITYSFHRQVCRATTHESSRPPHAASSARAGERSRSPIASRAPIAAPRRSWPTARSSPRSGSSTPRRTAAAWRCRAGRSSGSLTTATTTSTPRRLLTLTRRMRASTGRTSAGCSTRR